MKRFFTFIILAGIIYLSSCGNGANSTVAVLPLPDSTTKGSKFQVSFGSQSFLINDYNVNQIPQFVLFASDVYNATDSMWHARIQVTDRTNKNISMNLNLDNPIISGTSTGSFFVTKNTSTFTDYSNGDNKVYTVAIGSSVDITQSSYPIEGILYLTLYHNHDTINATGNFHIYY
jgi:hypothetical protein